MYHAQIPKDDYGELALNFNPVNFNAEEWVLAAKNAGMRYMVITSKHHDGFSMYHTRFSDFNIYDATPFKRDPLEELYLACQKHGLRFGVYYSHIIDWWDGWDGGMLNADRELYGLNKDNPMNTWDPNELSREEYIQNKSLPQVKELIQKFPEMIEVWFDYWYRGERNKFNNPQTSYQFYKALYDIAPGCLVNSRVGAGLGDYRSAGDNVIPSKTDNTYWETPGTLNNTWGYSKYDDDWKSAGELIYWIVDIASKGGNYLLNVGPKPDGTIPAESLDLLAEIGSWMKINGEAIYGTGKWVVTNEGSGSVEMKGTDNREQEGFNENFSSDDFWFTAKDKSVFTIAFKKPESGVVKIKTLSKLNTPSSLSVIQSVQLLGYDGALNWKQTNEAL
ncbi:MAG: alpha-L-fucosidase, partial [Desulfobacterales bacterium]|nr:alpha-L-fucosidase [Desulfobacterales bacterium]